METRGRGRPNFSRTLVAYARLPHAVPVIAVVATTLAIALVIPANRSPTNLIALTAAMFGAQLVIGVVNELRDEAEDRAAGRNKPLVTGEVSRRGAKLVLAAGACLLAVGSTWLGATSFALCVIGCAIGTGYSLWFKRTRFAWFPYLVALPLLPIWVAVSLRAFTGKLLWLYPLGALVVVAVQFAQSAPDIERDQRNGITSLTTSLGLPRTLWWSWAALLGSAMLVGALTWPGRATSLAALTVTIAVVVDAALFAIAPAVAADAAFPVAAASAGLLGTAWVYVALR